MQVVAAAYRELIAALRDPASVDRPRLGNLLKLVLAAGGDIHVLAPLCALTEAALRAGLPELSAGCERPLERAEANGVALTAGWVQSIPRLLAGCAAAAGRSDEAELAYGRSIAASRSGPAPVELALALFERARLRASRGTDGDAASAREDLREALAIASDRELHPLARQARGLAESLPP